MRDFLESFLEAQSQDEEDFDYEGDDEEWNNPILP